MALGSIVIGAGAGGALMCIVLFASYGMPRGPQGAFATIAVLAPAGGLAAAAIVGGTLARTLGSTMRRIMVAMVSVAGAAFVGFLVIVADMLAGKMGLLALAALCIGAIAWARRLVAGPASA